MLLVIGKIEYLLKTIEPRPQYYRKLIKASASNANDSWPQKGKQNEIWYDPKHKFKNQFNPLCNPKENDYFESNKLGLPPNKEIQDLIEKEDREIMEIGRKIHEAMKQGNRDKIPKLRKEVIIYYLFEICGFGLTSAANEFFGIHYAF